MNLKTNLAQKSNYGNKRSTSLIKYIVIHYTGNDGDTDEANAKYFNTGGRNASAHYFVDDDSITRSVPDDWIAWSVGGNLYPNVKQTGGGKYHKKCTNTNSISVELCDTKRNGRYDFTEATLANAIELVKLLVDTYHVPIDNIIRHFDVTGKHCPGPFVESESSWKKFKDRISKSSVTNTIDTELFAACQTLVNHRVIDVTSFNLWKRMDLMKLNLVPSLLYKMGGLNLLIQKEIITQPEIWNTGTYTVQNVRSLILKYSKLLEENKS